MIEVGSGLNKKDRLFCRTELDEPNYNPSQARYFENEIFATSIWLLFVHATVKVWPDVSRLG